MISLAFSLLLVLAAVASGEQRNYSGDKVFRIVPKTDEQLAVIRRFQDGPSEQFDFWVEPSLPGKAIVLHVGAKSIPIFTEIMNATNTEYAVQVEDVQKLIDDTAAGDVPTERSIKRRSAYDISIVGTYPSLADTNFWLDLQCFWYPKLASCGDVGQSYEGRTIKYIKLGRHQPYNATKKKVWLEGTIHAREWISTGTVIYLIDRLLNSYNSDATTKRMLDTYDWYIIPIVNPDGYEYTRSTDRFWRKTRSQSSDNNCFGADLNRNWGFKWASVGSSDSPCSELYHGTTAFSEPETRAMSDFIYANKENSVAYFAFHSNGQYWLVPHGVDPKPDDFDELARVAKIGAEALMSTNNEAWKVGNIADILYEASGSSVDWAKASAGIQYTYALELRPASGTGNGFIVSTSEIEPSGREAWAGIVAALDSIY